MTIKTNDKKYLDPDVIKWFVIALLFLERLISLFVIGITTLADCDDVCYINSAFTFAETGVLSAWNEYPSPIIMPGTTLVLGAIAALFGDGTAFFAVAKLIWITFGTFTFLYLYKSVSLFLPKWYALGTAALLVLPNHAWIDNVLVTETPYLFFFCMNMYYTLKLGKEHEKSAIIFYSLSFVAALCFRANILIFLPLSAIYIYLSKQWTGKELAKMLCVFAAILLVFLIPWTIRNYIRFDAFMPISNGSGNPMLKGTYQGVGFPEDEELDYETNVYRVIRERYAEYYNEDGELEDMALSQYIIAEQDALMAKYRMREWFKRDPAAFLKSYLVLKPMCIQFWVYYWGPYDTVIIPFLNIISKVNMLLCLAGLILSLIRKEKREIMLFLSLVYAVHVYAIATSYAVERYAAMLLPIRYFASAIGVYLLIKSLKELRKEKA